MNQFCKRLALFLALITLTATVATACDKGDEPTETETETSQSGGSNDPGTTPTTPTETEPVTTPSTPGGTDTPGTGEGDEEVIPEGHAKYYVTVKSVGGLGLEGIAINVYQGAEMKEYKTTGTDGSAYVILPIADGYTVKLMDTPALKGYTVAESYPITGENTEIVLTSSVILDSDLNGIKYKTGDVIRDFTVATTDGTTFNLAETLQTKKGVLINFFYTSCSPCVTEFPFMQEAYEKYQDDIEVIALNHYPTDTVSKVKNFKEEMGLTFPVAKDYTALGTAFELQGYPTSIFVDRYGVICLIEIGGLTSVKPFDAAFAHFASDNYQQTLFTHIGELTPIEKPNVEMPSSDEIAATVGLNAHYYPETEGADAEYSWPFVLDNLNGVNCISTPNSKRDSSFATLHVDVTLTVGQALAVDWFAETERSVDILYILVDGKDILQISGESEDWQTCYPFIATEDGTYKVTFIYLKDDSTDVGADKVYLTNFRIIDDVSDIEQPTYIYRFAATNPNKNGLGYKNYATVVYNETDGYYHVGTVDGPLLLVNLMTGTRFHDTSINDLGYNGQLVDGNVNYYDIIETYANYSINGTMYGYSPVTKELQEVLVKIAAICGKEQTNPNEWLQMCAYYDAYGHDDEGNPAPQLGNPVEGVAFFAAFDAVEYTEDNPAVNTVTYDGRVIMPRGFKYKFVPEKSGVYFIESQSSELVNGWIFDEKGNSIYTYEVVDRLAESAVNVSMIYYMEAGKAYYIDIAYYDIYKAGTFTFTVKYLGESYRQFHVASPGYFTYELTDQGGMGETIAGGINVALGEDGYYHELRADGTLGSIVYADFTLATGVMSHSISDLINLDAFDFTLNEYDQEVLAQLEKLGGDVNACRDYYKNTWLEYYDEYAEIYKLEEVLAGTYHGIAGDLTDEISAYLDKMITGEAAELEGCVPVDTRLAEILQVLMDKFTFQGVEHSWTKLCYYYKDLGSAT